MRKLALAYREAIKPIRIHTTTGRRTNITKIPAAQIFAMSLQIVQN